MGHEIVDRNIVDPYVEVSIYAPDWPNLSSSPPGTPTLTPNSNSTSRVVTARTGSVKNNGFNPVWQEKLHLTFSCVANLFDLVFVRFTVLRDGENDGEPIAVYCISLGSLAMGMSCLVSWAVTLIRRSLCFTGYRHLPLHDSQLSQYLFSTLFVKCSLQDS